LSSGAVLAPRTLAPYTSAVSKPTGSKKASLEGVSDPRRVRRLSIMRQFMFFSIVGLMILFGILITLRQFGWPSDAERKNKIKRSLKSGFGGMMLGIGLILLVFYWTSPETFWVELSFTSVISLVFFFVIPVFVLLVIASYLQYSALERLESRWKSRLKQIIGSKTNKE
jgi:hypothetical protein